MSGSDFIRGTELAAATFKPAATSTNQTSAASKLIGLRQAAEMNGKSSPPVEAAQASETEKASQEELRSAVAEMSGYLETVSRNLEFRVDDTTGETVISVVDRETSEVIRQIPSEEVLALAKHLSEQMDVDSTKGVLLQSQA